MSAGSCRVVKLIDPGSMAGATAERREPLNHPIGVGIIEPWGYTRSLKVRLARLNPAAVESRLELAERRSLSHGERVGVRG